jgi:hypothetical protein
MNEVVPGEETKGVEVFEGVLWLFSSEAGFVDAFLFPTEDYMLAGESIDIGDRIWGRDI